MDADTFELPDGEYVGLLAGLAALGMAVLHCREVFWLPALSPVIFNVVVISAMLAGWWAGGTEAVPAALAAGMPAMSFPRPRRSARPLCPPAASCGAVWGACPWACWGRPHRSW